jgi:hypothetical protein
MLPAACQDTLGTPKYEHGATVLHVSAAEEHCLAVQEPQQQASAETVGQANGNDKYADRTTLTQMLT